MVLFVEDVGFEVVDATDADEAIQLLVTRANIQIVSMDVDIPGRMSGLRLASAARDRWPPICIIATSVYARYAHPPLLEGAVLFAKPYDIERVANEVHRMGMH